jgi:hypothetical protein
MKHSFLFLILAGMINGMICLSASAEMPKITSIRSLDPLIARSRTVTEIVISGSGFFPAKSLDELHGIAQLNYRRVFPTMGPWQTAIFGRGARPTSDNSPVEISSIGSNEMQAALFEGIVMYPGMWTFTYCIQGVGCSNSMEITVQDPSGPVPTILDSAKDLRKVAPGAGYWVEFRVADLKTLDPTLMVGSVKISGNGYPSQQKALFYLDSSLIGKPTVAMAKIYDKATDATSNAVMLRIFDVPALRTPLAPIVQHLGVVESVHDAVLDLDFQAYTFPGEVAIIDANGASHGINPPLDLLTNRLRISIPASWLKIGESELRLTLKNIAGASELKVPVSISKPVMTPIPGTHPHPLPTIPPTPPIPPHFQ